jgi:ketosteroid isomerase-like protein
MTLRLPLVLLALAAAAPATGAPSLTTPGPAQRVAVSSSQGRTPGGAPARRQREAEDLAAVRRVLEEQEAAWNRGDLEGFMQGYWKSDSLTFYAGGDIVHGWQVTYERYQKRYRSEGREMGQLAFFLHDVRLLGPGHALVRGEWRLKLSAAQSHGLFTLWLRSFPGVGWRIVHDHSSAAP